MRVEMPLGDVVDRVTILRIKAARIAAPAARSNVGAELAAIDACWREAGLPEMTSLADWDALSAVNLELWEVEDRLREHEARGDFGAEFVALARSVYRLNDQRAALKRRVNTALRSRLVEEKSYAEQSRYIQGDLE